MNTHKLMGFVWMLGIDTIYTLFCCFKLFCIGYIGLSRLYDHSKNFKNPAITYDSRLNGSLGKRRTFGCDGFRVQPHVGGRQTSD